MVTNGNGKMRIDGDWSIDMKWCCFRFCPSVFFYLCTVIPSVWFLELDLAERRVKFNVTQALGLVPSVQGNFHLENEDTLPVNFLSIISVLRQDFFSLLACPMENSGRNVDTNCRTNLTTRSDHWTLVVTRWENDDTRSTFSIITCLHRHSRYNLWNCRCFCVYFHFD